MPGEMAPPPNAGQIRILGEPFVVDALASLIRAQCELQVLDQSEQIINRRDQGVRRYMVVRFRPCSRGAEGNGFL